MRTERARESGKDAEEDAFCSVSVTQLIPFHCIMDCAKIAKYNLNKADFCAALPSSLNNKKEETNIDNASILIIDK